jgi:uncharacterized membrane protein
VNDHDRALDVETLQAGLDSLAGEVRSMTAVLARDFVNGEILTLNFGGPKEVTSVVDDRGSNALAYAVYNPTAFNFELAAAGGLILIPKQKVVVAPVTVNGHISVSVKPGEAIGTEWVQVLRWRFPTPQPFYVGDLST